ncbi:MAG: GGDEF domain-containing protein [Bacilli bacterium]|nr:GGDEF domain-containing protein [Bacilli bacterium]
MKKNNKKILLILGSIILVIAFITTIYVVLTTPDKTSTLTALEKRWVEQNKNKVINVAVLNNVPLYGYEGKGIFFDFLEDFEKDINLEFNKVSYNHGNAPSLEDYKFEITDKINDNQLLVYQDYYIALSKNNERYDKISDFSGLDIGTLNNKVGDITYYLTDAKATFTTKENIDDLLDGLKKDELDTIIIPYNMYLDIILNNDYYIVYNFKDIYDNYVLTLSQTNETVNNIIKKYIELWKNTKFNEYYSDKFNELYFESKDISTKSQADFKGKIYTYGYVENLPFENVVNNQLIGINGEYFNSFASLTDIEIEYEKFNSIEELRKAFNENKIDIMFNNFDNTNSINNAYKTTSVFDEEYVILTNVNNNRVFDSIKSLKGETVYILKDSLLIDYVNKNVEVQIKTFDNNKKLLDNLNDDMIIILDYDTYNYYKNTQLDKFILNYQGNMNINYNFIVKNSKDNEILAHLLDYYVSSINYKSVKNNAYQTLIINPKNETVLQTIINYFLYIVLPILIIGGLLYVMFTKRKKKLEIKKDEKLRYIDMLTSLKNRNYLNTNISVWDDSKIYPQTIVIVDLNNIKYINDNFGHEEGDNVIKAAANILIRTQLENSDIIRTDGNEFLIYLIGYSEDDVINYMRKLYKEMKELPHGFGAAFGYSMIMDDIKLVDDAINEATLDMRTNKES